MKAFHNNPALKAEIIGKMKAHKEADRLTQGHWWEEKDGEFTGCFYGCAIEDPEDDNPRKTFSERYSLPLWYTYLTECIFEGLPEKEALDFPVQALEIIPVGADLNAAYSKYQQAVLTDQLRFVEKGSKQEKAIKQVIDLFSVPLDEIDKEAAESAAEYAARSAARSAEYVESAGWYAARYAARSAARSAWYAARSAWSAEYAAWSADATADSAGSEYYTFLRDVLFESIVKTT